MKIIHGWSLDAKENKAETSFWDSPYHLSVNIDISKFINEVLASFAVALAINVLPHPGGPWSKTPEMFTLLNV